MHDFTIEKDFIPCSPLHLKKAGKDKKTKLKAK